MTFFFIFYLMLTALMIMNKIYCLVYHKHDFLIKKVILATKGVKSKTDPQGKATGLLHASLLRDFYGSVSATIFVFIIELAWFIVGLFSFMWPFFLGLFVINAGVNRFEHGLMQTSLSFFATKFAYLILYGWFLLYFINHYYQFLNWL